MIKNKKKNYKKKQFLLVKKCIFLKCLKTKKILLKNEKKKQFI